MYNAYTTVKIVLLLLRQHTTERYADVAHRIGTDEANCAIQAKLGQCFGFTKSNAATLLALSSHPTIAMFAKTCILNNDLDIAARFVRFHINDCKSIQLWLRDYLMSKMATVGL